MTTTLATPPRQPDAPRDTAGPATDVLRTVSTRDVECPHATVVVDPGPGNTAVAFLRGVGIMNCAVLRPRVGGAQREADVDDPDRELWAPSGELVSLFDPRPDGGYRTNAELLDLLRGVSRRVQFAHDWLVRTYADPDEPVYAVVEVPEGVPRGYSALAKSLTLALAAMIVRDLDCDTIPVEARLCAGERHRADRNPTGKPVPVELVYPPMIHGAWPDAAEPDIEGRPVAMLPNEDVGKRNTDDVQPRRRTRDAQAAFDIGKFYWMDDRERHRMRVSGRKGRSRGKARVAR